MIDRRKFWIVVACVAGLWVLWPFIAQLILKVMPAELGRAGLFGDMFGGINSFFAALAFIGVLWTSIQQREDRKLIERQAFDNTFFELIRSLRDVERDVEVPASEYRKLAKGLEAFRIIKSLFLSQYESRAGLTLSAEDGRALFVELYNEHVRVTAQETMDAYFAFLEEILSFLDENDALTHQAKMRYARLLRAQLTSPVLAVLSIVALDTKRFPNISRCADKYHLLTHLPKGPIRDLFQGMYYSAFNKDS